MKWYSPEDKPGMRVPVIVAGVLEFNRHEDTHEGYWTGKCWMSVRIEEGERLHIDAVTAWAEMPKVPAENEIRRQHES